MQKVVPYQRMVGHLRNVIFLTHHLIFMERLTTLKDLVTSLEIDFSRATKGSHAELWDQVAKNLEQIMAMCLEMARHEVQSGKYDPSTGKFV